MSNSATAPLDPQERPVWDEGKLRKLALAYRDAHRRGQSEYHAFKAALRLAEEYFPQAQDHGSIVAHMLVEAIERWGPWLMDAAPEPPAGTTALQLN